MNIETIDLRFQGTPHVIAAFLIRGPRGAALVESGPGSTLPALIAGLESHGLEPADVTDVLLTHIHLDHAGAAGWWAGQGARIWVHPNGAPHLVDPSKLISSASRIYGDRMERLWGEILPAPAERVHAIGDGTTIHAGGVKLTAVETPGHARHHHVYRLDDVAFTGDAAGILLPGNDWIDLPAPPPEFDREAWNDTLERLRGLGVSTLYRTHFGPASNVKDELDRFEAVLEHGTTWIGDLVRRGVERNEMKREFTERMRGLAGQVGIREGDLEAYELANPREMSVDGIARYWRKRGEAEKAR